MHAIMPSRATSTTIILSQRLIRTSIFDMHQSNTLPQLVGQMRLGVLDDEIRVDELARRVHPMPKRTNVRGLCVHVPHHDVAFRDDAGQPVVLTLDFLFLPQLGFG